MRLVFHWLCLIFFFLPTLSLAGQSFHFEGDGTEFEDGSRRILENVQFREGSTDLHPDHTIQLDSLILLLIVHPNWVVEIGGHRDKTCRNRTGRKFTLLRAETVVNYMTSRGIPATQLVPQGYGDDMPWFPSTPPQEAQRNNRVDWKVVSH